MQAKYVEHYTAAFFDTWFKKVASEIGTAPFQAVVQNHLYTQDPDNPTKVRIQTFIRVLLAYTEKLKSMPDPDPAPILYENVLAEECTKVN